MFALDFSAEANAINQALFEDKQCQLESEVEQLRCVLVCPCSYACFLCMHACLLAGGGGVGDRMRWLVAVLSAASALRRATPCSSASNAFDLHSHNTA